MCSSDWMPATEDKPFENDTDIWYYDGLKYDVVLTFVDITTNKNLFYKLRIKQDELK